MSGREERQSVTAPHNRSSSARVRVVLTAVVCLCVLAAVVVAAAVLSTGHSIKDTHPAPRSLDALPGDQSLAAEHDSTETHAVRHARAARRNSRTQQPDMSCFSKFSNDTIPAAHIKGHGGKFHPSTSESSNENPDAPVGYQQRWQCDEFQDRHQHSAHAFVDGGMGFNQSDKAIHVPVCGYYHVFSQVLFHLDPAPETSLSVNHQMKIERNCPSWPDPTPISVIAKSSVGPLNPDAVTTYTSDVIRLCEGGRIWIQILDRDIGVPCCPSGDEQGTFMGAVLLSQTSCHWPPSMDMENTNDPDNQLN